MTRISFIIAIVLTLVVSSITVAQEPELNEATTVVIDLGGRTAAPAASDCIQATTVAENGTNHYVLDIQDETVEIDTRDGSVVTFHDIRDLENLDYVRGMDLVVESGQHIRSTEPLDGLMWVYPPECEFAHVVEFVVRDRDYRGSYDVPLGWFFADWRNTEVFEEIDS